MYESHNKNSLLQSYIITQRRIGYNSLDTVAYQYSIDGPQSTVYDFVSHATILCSEKNTHSHFLSYLHELFVDLNKNCSKYTQGLIDSDDVKIRYSLQSMT